MIKVSVLYPNTEGSRFDMDYYVNNHMPLVTEKLGAALKGTALEKGISGPEPGSKVTYLVMSHLLFDSMESFHGAFGPHAQSIMSDIPNFTNTQPVVQLSEVIK